MGDGRINTLKGRDIIMDMPEYYSYRVARYERDVAGDHFPSHDPYGIQVSLCAGIIIFYSLRCEI